jgi:hypothetical protein
MYFRHDEWNSLRGAEVQVWRGGTLLRTGVVDAATDDSSIAWVAADANDRRRLVDKASGYVLKISSKQLILRSLTGRGGK